MLKKIFRGPVLAVLALLATSSTLPAQVNITTPDTTLCGPVSVTLNATIGSSAGNFVIFTDDIYSPVFNLGFPFTFYGNTYTQCVISSNGFISFNVGNAGLYSNYSIPPSGGVPGNPNCRNAIMGPYADIDPSEGGSIEYSTQGVAPNRRFVLTFCDVPMFSCTTLLSRFQIILFEGTNEIEFHISNMPNCPTWNNGAAIEGVQNATGTDAVVVTGRNYPGQWTASNSSHRFTPSGNTYTFTSVPFQFYPSGLNAISWYENGTTLAGTGNSVTVTPTAVSTFYVATAQGCIGTSSDTVTVTIGNPLPVPVPPSPVTFCQGIPAAPLTVGVLQGATPRWYTAAVGGSPLPMPPVPPTTTPGSTFYYVSQAQGGCESDRVPVEVIVLPAVDASFSLSRDSLCQTDERMFVTFNGTAPAGTTYTWDFGEAMVYSGSGEGPYELSWNSYGEKEITLLANAAGCTDETSGTVYVKEKPPAAVSIPLPDGCVGDVREVRHAIVGGPSPLTYQWNFAGGEVVKGKDAGPYEIRWTTSGEKAVTLITEKDGCYSDVASDTINYYDLPLARIEPISDRVACIGDTINLTARAGEVDDFYRWQPYPDFVRENYINNTRNAQYVIKQSGPVTLLVLSHHGCESRDSVYFSAESCCQVFVPTAFSPNGDGKNDFFRIGGGDRYRRLVDMRVVNRWGQIVWNTRDGRAGWDGLYYGEPQEPGVYQYLLIYECPDGKLMTTKGDLTLIR